MTVATGDSKKYSLINEFEKIQNEHELNECAKKLQNYFQTVSRQKSRSVASIIKGPNSQKKRAVNLENKHEIQGLFENRPHRAVQEIIFEPYFCEVDPEKIEKYYFKRLSIKSECKISELSQELWKNHVSPTKKSDSKLEKTFNSIEVRSKLNAKIYSKLAKSRSVGLDMLEFQHLKKHDPESSIITAFFNACLRLQKLPQVWKEFYSVLVNNSKEGDRGDLKNWKTITVLNTTLKLFLSLIAARLIEWSKETNRLNSTQRGYLANNAACESSFILQECKKYANENKKDLAVAWINFSNASDSISQEAIDYALDQHCVPISFKNIIQSASNGYHTYIRLKPGYSNKIPILKGLPQGSPLNPILIDLALEPILRKLMLESNNVFKIYNQEINHLAIPDEIVLIAESKEKLQNLLKSVEEVAKLIGIKFNIDKCLTYHCDKNNKTHVNNFIFFGQKLKTLPDEKIIECFGVRQGLSIGQPGIPTVEEMLENVAKISTSNLNNFQKLDAVQSFIIPRVENCLRGIQQFDENHLNNVEEILEDKIKVWLSLPSDSSLASIVFQAYNIESRSVAHVNYLPFLDLFCVMKIVQAFKMFTSEDKVVHQIAFESLKTEVTQMIQDSVDFKTQLLTDYLSGDLFIKDFKGTEVWSAVRKATQKVNEKIYLKWIFEDNQMKLKIKETNGERHILLTDNVRFNVEDRLKSQLVLYYIDQCKKANPATENTKQTVSSRTREVASNLKKIKNTSKKSACSNRRKRTENIPKTKRQVVQSSNNENEPPNVKNFLHTSNFPVFTPNLKNKNRMKQERF